MTEPFQIRSWKVTVTNAVPSQGATFSHTFEPLKPIEMTATIALDAETYDALVGKPEDLYTFEYSVDLNPWHREARGFQARARKARHIVWWELQRKVLRRKLIESYSITVPNCRAEAE